MTEFEGTTNIYCECPYCTGGSILSAIKRFFTRKDTAGCGSEYEQDVTIDVEPQENDSYA